MQENCRVHSCSVKVGTLLPHQINFALQFTTMYLDLNLSSKSQFDGLFAKKFEENLSNYQKIHNRLNIVEITEILSHFFDKTFRESKALLNRLLKS